jgi:hypothetical protein
LARLQRNRIYVTEGERNNENTSTHPRIDTVSQKFKAIE